MKDSLIGITTLSILIGLVWVSQQKTDSYLLSSNIETELSESTNNKENVLEIENETSPLKSCDLCNMESEINNELTFNEVFKFCRTCLGDEEDFQWKGKLYSTNLKEKINLVEKEDTELKSPPSNETVDSE